MTVEKSIKTKQSTLFSIGVACFLIAPFIGGGLMMSLLIRNIRFVGSIPTLSFMVIPMLLGMWCMALGTEKSKRKQVGIVLSCLSSIFIISALIMAK